MNVTRRQAQVLDALCEYGHNKLIARHLKVELKAVEAILTRIKASTGIDSRVVLAVQWDRQRRR